MYISNDILFEKIKKQFLRMFNETDGQWESPYLLPRNFITKYEYKGINRILLSSSPYWVTKNQLKKKSIESGWKLKENSDSSFIVFFKKEKIEEENTREKKIIIRETSFIKFYEMYSVLDIIDDEDQPIYIPAKESKRIKDLKKDLIEFCMFEKINLEETSVRGYSYYNYTHDKIGMYPHFDDDIEYSLTLAHEIIHATGHEKRLNRNFEYEIEEGIAEIGSLFLTSHYIPEIPHHNFLNATKYIKNWLSVAKDYNLISILSNGEKATRYVLNKLSSQKKELIF
ncbi:zincin-like metallopeptidase domain-containing protein [Persephonella sp.]